MKQRVKAWGSPDYPDLDYETDKKVELATLTNKYPFIQVALLEAISHSDITNTLAKLNER